MKGFPATWTPPVDDELYVIKKTSANCVALAVADGIENKGAHPCVWINQFGKGKVFGLTTGHRTETLADSKYLEMISRGFVWAVAR
jgi:type 1 glutamine amidotransferase